MRSDNRAPDEMRPVRIRRGFTRTAAGSVLISFGQTQVLCTASIVDGVPDWRSESGAGWLTAEYDMLPASTPQRRQRSRGRVDGRAQEIQRLIGRSLRVVTDLERLGPRTIYMDCDVLQADGGTRTAAITGAFVALQDALTAGEQRGLWTGEVLTAGVAAVSVCVCGETLLLDPDYGEDVRAEVDCNLILTTRDQWVEVQATAEGVPFSDAQLARILQLGRTGIQQLFALQQDALKRPAQPEV
jgi:ribonuclease PH